VSTAGKSLSILFEKTLKSVVTKEATFKLVLIKEADHDALLSVKKLHCIPANITGSRRVLLKWI